MAKLLSRPSLIDVFCHCQVSSFAYRKIARLSFKGHLGSRSGVLPTLPSHGYFFSSRSFVSIKWQVG